MTTYWGPRAEEPEAIARKFLRTLAALATVNPAFGNWHVGYEEGVPLASLSFDDVVQFIRDGSVGHVDPEDPHPPVRSLGYNFFALNTLEGGPRAVTVSIHAGQSFSTAHYVNTAGISTPALCAENADLITLAVMKPALLALIEIWQPTWCGLRPAAIFDLQTDLTPDRPSFQLTWVTYLSARFAPMVTPPESVITEYLPDGGLLMIATEDRFDVDNAAHMAAARAIEAAMAPVNALPWPPDGEPLPWLIK